MSLLFSSGEAIACGVPPGSEVPRCTCTVGEGRDGVGAITLESPSSLCLGVAAGDLNCQLNAVIHLTQKCV